MSEEEDYAWSLGWLSDHPWLKECASARVTIDSITHRVVLDHPALKTYVVGWRTLCGSHRLWIHEGRFEVVGASQRRFDFSSAGVDCLCCLPAGG